MEKESLCHKAVGAGSGKSGKSVRLVSKPKPEGMTKEVCCVNYEAVVGLKTVK